MPHPRKHFGQHFLCDPAIVNRIVAALHPQQGEHLIEIGPGQGALTLPVLKKAQALTAIEVDRDLIPQLEHRCLHHGDLEIYNEDVLTFDFARLKTDDRLLRIFGNLPYNISTPLLFHLLNFAPLIADMLFMLQKEVAHRITAKANTDPYGRLSVMVQYHYEVSLLFDVPGSAFYPMPQVQSSMVHFVPYRTVPYQARDYVLFESIVRHAFGQRRKTLRNSLKDIVSDEVWSKISIHSDLRPETLTVNDFVEISNAIPKAY